jgi:hypothetical protein
MTTNQQKEEVENIPQVLRISYTPQTLDHIQHERAVCKVRGLVAVRRCYAQGSGDCYAKL